jgi:O-antigen ligase
MFAAFPLFGVGYGVFQYVSPSYFDGGSADSTFSHNQYLNILAEQGVVGVAIVGALVVVVAVLLVRSRSPFRGPALAMGATFLVTSMFLHSATVFQSSSLIWLVMAAALVTDRDRTDPIEEA